MSRFGPHCLVVWLARRFAITVPTADSINHRPAKGLFTPAKDLITTRVVAMDDAELREGDVRVVDTAPPDRPGVLGPPAFSVLLSLSIVLP